MTAPTPSPSRRTVLATAGTAALTASLAGCAASATPAATPSVAASVTVAKADIPVGSGKVLTDAAYVVTQPEAGTFMAFNKTCTHQQCPVSEVSNQAIICKCHGSHFSLKDGSVLEGPAPKPLTAATVSVQGDNLSISG
ncbi:MAG: Rieske (2Fe-2S) protein [Micropruina sp.]|nr:Rieske (2Fe-2S) protein [Micropruina sp.]